MDRTTDGQRIVIFHSALGLRPAILDTAEALRAAGHTVDTPDLYDGQTFDDLDAGIAKRDALGIPEVLRRTQAAVADLPPELVYVGYSMGTGPAELLAATRPGARAAILLHGALAPAEIDVQAWPGVPVQIHHARHDPWVDVDQVRALEDAVRKAGATAEVHVYERGGHLFEDPASTEPDSEAARLVLERVLAFIDQLPSTGATGGRLAS
jgi:dienelactone hydrolase